MVEEKCSMCGKNEIQYIGEGDFICMNCHEVTGWGEKEDKQVRNQRLINRARNRLNKEGIAYKEHQSQFAINVENDVVDYYPTTAKWFFRKNKKNKGQGLKNLIKKIKVA